MKKFFKPEDFLPMTVSGTRIPKLEIVRQQMADIANYKLEREGKIVYRTHEHYDWKNFLSPDKQKEKALLINIEAVEQCTHPKDQIFFKEDYFECACGAKFKLQILR